MSETFFPHICQNILMFLQDAFSVDAIKMLPTVMENVFSSVLYFQEISYFL